MYPDLGRRLFCLRPVLAFAALCVSAASATPDDDQKAKEGDKNSTSDGEVYEPGGDVKPPKLVHYVEPAFSSDSKEAFVEGTVKISAVVKTDGTPTKLKVVRGLNTEEDRTATEAVKQWRFQPGTKQGQPVNVKVTVEVEFHLL